jgi:hypothetical protein
MPRTVLLASICLAGAAVLYCTGARHPGYFVQWVFLSFVYPTCLGLHRGSASAHPLVSTCADPVIAVSVILTCTAFTMHAVAAGSGRSLDSGPVLTFAGLAFAVLARLVRLPSRS